MNIVLAPHIPDILLLLAIVLGTIIGLLGIWRHWPSGILRTIAIAGLLGLLANPQWRQSEKTPLNDVAIILVDETGSQSLDDRDAVTENAATKLEATLSALEESIFSAPQCPARMRQT